MARSFHKGGKFRWPKHCGGAPKQGGGFDSLAAHKNQHIINMEITPKLSKRISAGTRVYYIDVHEDRKSQPYVSISEIPTSSSHHKDRHRIFLFGKTVERMARALEEVAQHLRNGITE